jgi:hypothetical protein
MNEIPLMLRIEKARNELRFSVNQISAKYDLPGYIIDLIINGVLSEELQQRVSMMAEQIDVIDEEVDDHGD